MPTSQDSWQPLNRQIISCKLLLKTEIRAGLCKFTGVYNLLVFSRLDTSEGTLLICGWGVGGVVETVAALINQVPPLFLLLSLWKGGYGQEDWRQTRSGASPGHGVAGGTGAILAPFPLGGVPGVSRPSLSRGAPV